MGEGKQYWFDEFQVEVEERSLYWRGDKLPLTPKAFETLLCLVESAGRVVSKDDLLQRVWPETHVEEGTLAQNVFTLRKILGEKAPGAALIETVPKLGYRFLAAVRDYEGAPPAAPPRRGQRIWLKAAVVGLLGCAALLLVARRQPADGSQPRSLAVLPFQNLSPDSNQEYAVEGLTDELTTQLAQQSGLRVTSRTSAAQYLGTRKPVRQIARELNVDAVLEGSVEIVPGTVHVTARLVRAGDDRTLWAADYNRRGPDLLQAQQEIAREVCAGLRSEVLHQSGVPAAAASEIPEAREAYLKGVYAWNRRTEAGYLTAIEYFEQALTVDAKYAHAYAGLADAYALLGSMPNAAMARAEAMEKARTAAVRAIEFDDTLADAHTALAFVRMHYDFNWSGAEQEFRRALALNPNYATAHQWYAYLLMATGRTEAALAEMRRAELLDPLSMIIHCDLSELLRMARRYPEAIQQARQAVEMDPAFVLAHANLGEALMEAGRFDQAVPELQTAVRLSNNGFWMRAELAAAYTGHQRALALKQLQALLRSVPREHGTDHQIALLYTLLGDKEHAIEHLRRAAAEHDGALILIRSDAIWDPLRSDPRFQQIVRELGLSS